MIHIQMVLSYTQRMHGHKTALVCWPTGIDIEIHGIYSKICTDVHMSAPPCASVLIKFLIQMKVRNGYQHSWHNLNI